MVRPELIKVRLPFFLVSLIATFVLSGIYERSPSVAMVPSMSKNITDLIITLRFITEYHYISLIMRCQVGFAIIADMWYNV